MFKNPKNREYEIKKVLLITLFLNVLVALIKIIAGRLFNFLSLTSSGFDSLFDGSSNVLALITISMAYRPADFRHHYGYRKYENLGSLIISLLLLYTAVQIGQDAWHALHHENHPIFSWKLVFICLLSILVNFFVSTYEKRKGEELKSSILMADSHHTRGDYIVSFGVLISLIFIYFEIYWMDIVMSLGICFYLVSMAIDIVRMNLPDLLDASPHFTEKLYAQVKKFPRVLDCHKMRIRGNTSSMYIDFHILVEDKLSLKEAHNIAHELEDHIRLLLKDEVTELDITAHVEPYEENHHD